MLFTSQAFIFLYLPIVFFSFFLLAYTQQKLAALFLSLTSIFFYGYWNINYVPLLLGSITFNFFIGYFIASERIGRKKFILILGIVANLALLIYFKYSNFFLSEIGSRFGIHHTLEVVLPLGISFFTFTQIAFLVDVYKGQAKEYNFIQYLLFVT